MHRRHDEDALGERASLVEDDDVGVGQCLEIVRTLDEDALLGRPTDASEEGERNGDDQGAGARDDEEGERTQKPGGEAAEKVTRDERPHHGEGDGREDDDGRVDVGKARDEALAPRLVLAGVLHEVEDLRGGGLAELLGHASAHDAGDVHAARDDLVARRDVAGRALAGERHGVEARRALHDLAIEGYLLPRTNENRVSHVHVRRRDGLYLAVALHVGGVGTDVHELRDGRAALVLGEVLEELAHLEEEHDEDGLGELGLTAWDEADEKRAERGDGHEEVLVEGLSPDDALAGLGEHVVAGHEVGREEHQELRPDGHVKGAVQERRHDEQNRRGDDSRELDLVFLLAHRAPHVYL